MLKIRAIKINTKTKKENRVTTFRLDGTKDSCITK